MVLTDDEVKRLLTKEDRQTLLEIELELALRINDSKTFNKLAKEYSNMSENSKDNIYDQYIKNYEKINDSKITNDEILSYLELIINNYLDRYSSNAKNYKEFLRSVRIYNQLSSEIILNE